MKLITKDVDYAVKTLKYMARSGDRTHTVAELSGELDISLAYLRKILQQLSKKGVVSSSKGKSGGFSLGRSPGDISLYDLVLTFQGQFKLSNCRAGEEPCPEQTRCLVRKNVQEIEAFTRRKFQSLTLGTMLACPPGDSREDSLLF